MPRPCVRGNWPAGIEAWLTLAIDRSGRVGSMNVNETTEVPAIRRHERRHEVRHPLSASSTVRLVRSGSRLGGRIVDLSLSGCRIRMDERFTLGIYTRVEVEFQAAGLIFRIGGVIQAIHNQSEIGIRFLDVSERNRQKIKSVIEEIRLMPQAATEISQAEPISAVLPAPAATRDTVRSLTGPVPAPAV